jgi:hypothetical protein
MIFCKNVAKYLPDYYANKDGVAGQRRGQKCVKFAYKFTQKL